MQFYNNMCIDDTLIYIHDHNFDINNYNDDLKDILYDILDQLDIIETQIKSDTIIGIHKDKLEDRIRSSKKIIRRLFYKDREITLDEIDILAYDLLYVVDDIRRPWRWDVENNNKILKILSKYDRNDIQNHFYYSMQLYGHKV